MFLYSYLKILSTLKISEEDWGAMCEHAFYAIEHDTCLRSWHPKEGAGLISLLIYKCNAAEIDLASGPTGKGKTSVHSKCPKLFCKKYSQIP